MWPSTSNADVVPPLAFEGMRFNVNESGRQSGQCLRKSILDGIVTPDCPSVPARARLIVPELVLVPALETDSVMARDECTEVKAGRNVVIRESQWLKVGYCL